MTVCLEFAKKALKALSGHEKKKKDSSVDQTKTELFDLNAKYLHLEETRHCSTPGQVHPYGEAQQWKHHSVEMIFTNRNWEAHQDRGKDEQKKTVEENLIGSA